MKTIYCKECEEYVELKEGKCPKCKTDLEAKEIENFVIYFGWNYWHLYFARMGRRMVCNNRNSYIPYLRRGFI